jgi:hypothetical protein
VADIAADAFSFIMSGTLANLAILADSAGIPLLSFVFIIGNAAIAFTA